MMARPLEHVVQAVDVDVHHLFRVARVAGKGGHVVDHVETSIAQRPADGIGIGNVRLNVVYIRIRDRDVVENADIVTALLQLSYQLGTDVPACAQYKDPCHRSILPG